MNLYGAIQAGTQEPFWLEYGGGIMIRWQGEDGALQADDLFGILAAMARGEIMSFPALRRHQQQAWHCFAVQVAAMALIAAGRADLPTAAADWRTLLLGLTPEWPDGEAWALVEEDWQKPALLQPPLVSPAHRADYKKALATPDQLDMLVTSRNHDVKAARMLGGAQDDWLFALVTLQTMEGFLGAGNYGISRMNGGFASRMGLGLRPSGNLSAAFARDVHCLVQASGDPQTGAHWRHGPGLLWTIPWDGAASLAFTRLDTLYVDVCRRVRLQRDANGAITALAAGSKSARVAGVETGKSEDPWAPIRLRDNASLTASPATFGYRKFVELLDPAKVQRPLLARHAADDRPQGMVLVAQALVRGQGKTEGLHRREVPLSGTRENDVFETEYLDRMGQVAQGRAQEAGAVRQRLRLACFALVQGGPAQVRLDDKAAEAKLDPWIGHFDLAVDRVFFDAPFWAEFDGKPENHRLAWRETLRAIARDVFALAAAQAPRTDTRRVRALAVARNMLEATLAAYVKEARDAT